MTATATLRKQHAEIVEIVRQVEACLAPGKLPSEAGAVRNLLTGLAGRVNVHLAIEDDALYPRLRAHASPEVRSLAKRFSDEMSGLKAAFQDYLKRWTEPAIRADAAGFVSETKSVFAALGQRIRRENTELYAVVDKLG